MNQSNIMSNHIWSGGGGACIKCKRAYTELLAELITEYINGYGTPYPSKTQGEVDKELDKIYPCQGIADYNECLKLLLG